MFGISFKKLPAALAESMDKMKGSMLFAMAKRMPTKDAESMARHWGYLPEKSDITAAPATVVEKVNTAAPATVVEKLEIAPEQVMKPVEKVVPHWLMPDNFKDDHLLHPIFGKKIVDLGYKTVYLTNIVSLTQAQVWEKQRILRPDRMARIATSKIQSGRAQSLSGVITMYLDKKTGKAGIVDGQHRAGALMLLSQQGHWDRLKRNILIDVFNTDNDEDIAALFKEINSAEPVRLVDMPGEGASTDTKDILDTTVEYFLERKAEMFKISLKCKPPHLHEAIFRDDIFQSEILIRRKIKSSEELRKLILLANEIYAKRSDNEWEKILIENKMFKAKTKTFDDALKKARLNNWFLGLDSSWMHEP